MYKWIIEYWNDKANKVKCFSHLKGEWRDAPCNNITYIYVQKHGVRPAANPNKLYTTTMVGLDYYFLMLQDDVLVSGGWMETEKDGDGVLCYWYPDERWQENLTITRKPDFVAEEDIKIGVWVEEPWAARLGLSGESDYMGRREIKGCM